MKFDVINIQEVLVIIICGVGLVTAICFGRNDLAMAIGSGLVGYLGGTKSVSASNKE